MDKTKYYFAMFGNPTPPLKDTVESGIYHPDPKFAPFEPATGDILLLYCTGSYLKHPMRCPGIGVVLSKTNEYISYRYLPIKEPIYKDVFENSLNQEEQKRFQQKKFPVNWLFELSHDSFVKALSETQIDWP